MSYLIAVVFDNIDEASEVRETLRKEQSGGYITLDDSAIIVRDEDGKLHIKNEVDRGVKVGAMWGGLDRSVDRRSFISRLWSGFRRFGRRCDRQDGR